MNQKNQQPNQRNTPCPLERLEASEKDKYICFMWGEPCKHRLDRYQCIDYRHIISREIQRREYSFR